MELDHVLVAVPDLSAAADDFETRYGLPSMEGGRHPGWGTANRIVPLGDAYLELLAVVDEQEAAASAFGSWVADTVAQGGERLLGWAVRTSGLDAVAARLGLEAQRGARARPNGTELRWRSAGVERALAEPDVPFFIEWADGVDLPGRVVEPVGRVERLELTGDAERLASWLGAHLPRVVVEPGTPAVRRVVVDVGGRSVTVGA